MGICPCRTYMPMPGIYTPAWVFAVYTPQGSDLRASRILASRNNQVEIHLCISVTLPALWTYTGCAEGPERAAPCASVLVSEGCRLAIAVGTHALLCLHRSCSNKQQHKTCMCTSCTYTCVNTCTPSPPPLFAWALSDTSSSSSS